MNKAPVPAETKTQLPAQDAPDLTARLRAAGRHARSLRGKVLALSALFVLIAEVLVFIPSAANFRTAWLEDRGEAAHLASLAASAAGEMALGDELARELLEGAEAVAVARRIDGMNELILGGDIGDATLIVADLREMSLPNAVMQSLETLAAPEGRYLNILYAPPTERDALISVVIPEASLKRELWAFCVRIFWLSIFIAGVTGAALYVSLSYILVQPMRRLARGMTEFQKDPADPRRTYTPSRKNRSDELGRAEEAFVEMQAVVRQAFAERQRLAALGEAVAKINHDLRNVLASAQLISDRLAMSKDERVAGMGARLVRAIDRGVRLCQDTLSYGRSTDTPARLQPVVLAAALDDAAGDAFAAVGAAEWINRVDPGLRVSADPDHLHRIFLNLFRNAVQAMEGVESARLSIDAAVEDGLVHIDVRDNGPGVPEAVQETLFKPFSRTANRGGSGLGLSIAHELARALGGDIRLYASSPAGAVFRVTLKKG